MTTTTTPTTGRFENVTLYVKGGMGNVVKVRAKFVEVTTRKWAQYDNATQLTYRKPRQRKDRSQVLGYKPWFVVVEGDGPEVDDLFLDAQVDPKTGVSFQKSRYASFDPRFVSDFEARLAASGAKVLSRGENE